MPSLQDALDLAKEGFAVFPVRTGEKEPASRHGCKDAETEPDKIKHLWENTSGQKFNIGIEAGKSGLILVDVDAKEGRNGRESFLALGEFPETRTVSTPNGGLHYYFKIPPGATVPPNSKDEIAPGIEVKVNNVYLVAPPSILQKGSYRWVNPKTPVADVPGWFIELCWKKHHENHPVRVKTEMEHEDKWKLAKDVKDAFNQTHQVRDILKEYGYLDGGKADYMRHPNGDTEDSVHIRSLGSYHFGARDPLKGKGFTEDGCFFTPFEALVQLKYKGDFRAAISDINPQQYTMKNSDLEALIEENRRNGEKTPGVQVKKYDFTLLGNSEHFKDIVKEDMRWVSEWKTWIIWDGKRWRKDAGGHEAHLRGQKYVREDMLDHAKTIMDRDLRDKYLGWIKSSSNLYSVNSMLELTSHHLKVTVSELDAHPHLFNCQNCTIDFNTLSAYKQKREDLLTKISPVEYHPEISSEVFEQFVHRLFRNDLPVIEWLQRAIGYSMTGSDKEQTIFITHGSGSNGKTTLMEIIRHVMGDYSGVAAESLLLNLDRNSVNSDDVADLFGVRFCSVSETDHGQVINEPKLKRLTGGGVCKAMRKFERSFEFQPTHKIWMDCNHKPVIKGTDDGIWRRIKLIPFNQVITPEERDPNILANLKNNDSGILNWMLAGARKWIEDGSLINQPQQVTEASSGYREESDNFGAFLKECIIRDPGSRSKTDEVFNRYLFWTKENNYTHSMVKKTFTSKMQERGFQGVRSGNVKLYCDVKLISEDSSKEDENDKPF